MRVKDLQWQEMFIWPPEWATRLDECYKEWILIEVKLHKDKDPPYIYIEVMVALVVNLKRWVTLLKQRSPAFSWANAA